MTDLKWFKAVFLKHLKRGKNAASSFTSFLTSIFRLNRRIIEPIQCVEDVELRGALWVDSKPIEGLINRRVLRMRSGQVAWLRVDQDENFVTLENSRGCVNIKKEDWDAKYRKSFSIGH